MDLQNKLQEISPQRWKKMNYSDRQNSRRLVRAIEIIQNSNLKIQTSKLQFKTKNYDVFRIGLIASKEILYERVNERVVSRINQGMIEEARRLYENGLTIERMKQLGLEYGVLADYLDGKIKTRDELIQIMQNKIHRFVRRQLTWFKKENDVNWFDIEDKNYFSKIEKVVAKWYDSK